MKKLRTKFILIAMLSMFIVLAAIVGGMNIWNYVDINTTADRLTHMLTDNNGDFPNNKPNNLENPDENPVTKNVPPDVENSNKDPKQQMSAETPFQTRYFYVQYDTAGAVSTTSVDHIAAIDQTQAQAYAAQVKDTSDTIGFLDIYRYRTITNSTGVLCVFVDCEKELASFKGTLLTSLIMSFAGLLAVFILVFIFSKIIFHPVEESYRKQKQFITDASHELKTPLTIIDANTEVIELEHGESQWTKSNRNQVERLSAMIQQMITLTRMDETTESAQKQIFSLSDAIYESCELFSSVASSLNKSIDVEQVSPNINLNGNEAMIRQMLCLFLDNAIKYSSKNSTIELSLKKHNTKTVLTIKNNCEGLSAGNQDILLERFYRGDASRNSETGGSGIGLSVAKSIANAHKAKIHLESPDAKSLIVQIIFL